MSRTLLARLEKLVWVRRERARLRRVPRQSVSPKSLGSLSPEAVRSFMTSPDIAALWSSVHARLGELSIPDGTGGVNPGDRRALFHLIAGLRPARVLEIGTHIGASTVHIAAALDALDALRAAGAPAPRLLSVDIADVNDVHARPWLAYGATLSPKAIMESFGFDFVEFRTSPSLEVLRNPGEGFDFIFLDGDHSAATVYQELPAALDRLNPGGVVLLHDYFPGLQPLWPDGSVLPGPFLAVERLLAEGAAFEVIPLGELPWPTKLGSRVTNLTLVARRPTGLAAS